MIGVVLVMPSTNQLRVYGRGLVAIWLLWLKGCKPVTCWLAPLMHPTPQWFRLRSVFRSLRQAT